MARFHGFSRSGGEQRGIFGVGTTSPVLPFDSDQPIRAYGASIGSSCSPEGAFGYDSNSETLVICDSSGNWEQVSAQGESGTPGLNGSDGATWFRETPFPRALLPQPQ